MNIDDILNKDTCLKDVEELRDFVVSSFEDLDSLIILWETKDGEIYHRGYGESSYLIGLLEKAKYILLRKNLGDTRDKDASDEL